MVGEDEELGQPLAKRESIPGYIGRQLWRLTTELAGSVWRTSGKGTQLARDHIPALPQNKRESQLVRRSVVLTSILGLLAYSGFQYATSHYPHIVKKIMHPLGERSVSCGDDFKKEIDLKEDGVSLDEIVAQSFFTTPSKGPADAGFVYLTKQETTDFEQGEQVYLPEQTARTICREKDTDGVLGVSVGDEGEGGYVTKIDIKLPPAEILGAYYEGTLTQDVRRYPSLLTADRRLPSKEKRVERIETLYRNAALTLRDLNVSFVFGPVLDTVEDVDDPDNVISSSERGYSEDADTVIALSQLYIDAMHDQSIKVIGKHYIGAGYATEDPHGNLSTRDGMTAKQKREAVKPFRELASSLDGIMVTHLVNPNDGKPDSVSPETYRFIRQELGFEGIIITDDMDMKAIEKWYGLEGDELVERATLDALTAGADAVIWKSSDIGPVTSAIAQRMQEDSEFREQRMQSFGRLMKFKDVHVKGYEGLKEVIDGREGSDGITWVRKRVERGDSFLSVMAAEGAPFAGYDGRNRPKIRDNDLYRSALGQFTKQNGVRAEKMRFGKTYLFPDYTNDGIISRERVEVEGVTVTAPAMEASLASGQSFHWYLVGELGDAAVNDRGQALPVTTGAMKPHYTQFRKDNPDVTSLRRLRADKKYKWRDLNGDGKISFADPGNMSRKYQRGR